MYLNLLFTNNYIMDKLYVLACDGCDLEDYKIFLKYEDALEALNKIKTNKYNHRIEVFVMENNYFTNRPEDVIFK